MIRITDRESEGADPAHLEYFKGRQGIGKLIRPITRHLRAVNAEKYINRGEQKNLFP